MTATRATLPIHISIYACARSFRHYENTIMLISDSLDPRNDPKLEIEGLSAANAAN